MTRYLVATDNEDCSWTLCSYLDDHLDDGDEVYAINSLRGGGASGSNALDRGESALEVIEDRLGSMATVETHQYVRGNDPAVDIVEAANEFDVDELVIGLRRHSRRERIAFGSTLQATLRRASRPVRAIPA